MTSGPIQTCSYPGLTPLAAVFIIVTAFTEQKMWRKFLKPGNKEFESALLKLASETGAAKEVAEKVLRECNGDFALAKQKLQRQGSNMASKGADRQVSSTSSSVPYTDAPPPYSEAVEGAMALPTPLPPPYVSQEKDSLLGELKAVFPDYTDERCCTCFDPIRPDKSEGFSGEMIWHGLKVSQASCFSSSSKRNVPRLVFMLDCSRFTAVYRYTVFGFVISLIELSVRIF